MTWLYRIFVCVMLVLIYIRIGDMEDFIDDIVGSYVGGVEQELTNRLDDIDSNCR